jgi:hypothetical protein
MSGALSMMPAVKMMASIFLKSMMYAPIYFTILFTYILIARIAFAFFCLYHAIMSLISDDHAMALRPLS